MTTRLTNEYITWRRAASKSNVFEINLNIKYPEQKLFYRPGFWQTMKWAWIQYFSVLIVFIYVFRFIKEHVFSKQVLLTQRSTNNFKQS